MVRINRGENPVVVWGTARPSVISPTVAMWPRGRSWPCTMAPAGILSIWAAKGYTIRELVETLSQFLDFNYKFDTSKPSGFPRRVMDLTRAREWIDYNPSTSLLDGLKATWNWFGETRTNT